MNNLSQVEELQLQKLSDLSGLDYQELLKNKNLAFEKSIPFREQLLKETDLSDEIFQEVLAELSGLEYHKKIEHIESENLNSFLSTVPVKTAKKHLFFPADISESILDLAVVYPSQAQIFEEVASLLGKRLQLSLATEDVVLSAINQCYNRNSGTADEAAEILGDDDEFKLLTGTSLEEAEDLLDSDDDEPVKKLVNTILYQASKENASDIHIDPGLNETDVRSRVDGILYRMTKVPKHGHQPLINRVKVMGGLDISVKNKPQDGRTMITIGGARIDIRMSVLPTIQGERAVLRLLNQSHGVLDLEKLGVRGAMADSLKKTVCQPHGMILVTGPTGSGKTTSLYAALKELDENVKNIITLEDPVEYKVSGYGQVQVNEKAGLTFSSGLRSILRQDPDVIMVGEIRDSETAKIAVQSALTGHLVLSTLHTNDAVSSVIRLIDMGIEPFLVSSTLRSVISQRLVRKLCDFCKEEESVSWEYLSSLGFPEKLKSSFKGIVFSAKGCSKCMHTGYRKRIGVFEYLQITDNIREVIANRPGDVELQKVAIKENMRTLLEDCAEKVLSGDITLEEMYAVVFIEPGNADTLGEKYVTEENDGERRDSF